MKKLLFSVLLLVLFQTASAEKIFWISNLDNAIQTAKLQNKLLLVDFYADWCGPCKKMDMDVWSHENVTSQANKFVFAKIDIDQETTIARRYNVQSIPLVLVMDARGEALVEMTGYRDEPFVSSLLTSLPADMENIYKMEAELEEKGDSEALLMDLAKAYQDLTEAALGDRVAVEALVDRSEQYMSEAGKIAESNPVLQEEIALLGVLNDAYRGRGKRCAKLLDKMDLANIQPANRPLLYYTQAVVNLQNEEKKEAQKAIDQLAALKEASIYAEKAEKYRSQIGK